MINEPVYGLQVILYKDHLLCDNRLQSQPLSRDESIMLTALGRQIRKLRLDKGVRLKDMADAFEVTSSFLSAVENGRKAMPDDWLQKLDRYFAGFGVSRAQWAKLAEESKLKLVVDLTYADPFDRATWLALGKHYSSLPPEKKEQIRKMLDEES